MIAPKSYLTANDTDTIPLFLNGSRNHVDVALKVLYENIIAYLGGNFSEKVKPI